MTKAAKTPEVTVTDTEKSDHQLGFEEGFTEGMRVGADNEHARIKQKASSILGGKLWALVEKALEKK